MRGFVIAALALLSVAEATLIIGTTATAGAVTISAGSAALGLLGGAVILKSLVLAKLIASRRGKRSAEEDNEAAFAILTNSEPAQCYKRLICDLSAGAIQDKDQIITLFNGEVSPISPKFEYATAAKVGKIVKNSQYCEVRYSCPLSTQEIQKLFN